MNKLKMSIKMMQTKSDLEKNIVKILCSSHSELPSEKYVRRNAVLQELKAIDHASTGRDKLVFFTKKMESLKIWEDVAKMLIIAHRAIDHECTNFVIEFPAHPYKNIQELSTNIKELKLYARCSLMKFYLKYIRTYAEHFFAIVNARKINARTATEVSVDLPTLREYITVKQLLTFAYKIEDFFNASAEMLNDDLVKEIGGRVLKDCIDLYHALSTYVSGSIGKIFELDDDSSTALDELYSDLIRLTPHMASLYQLKDTLSWIGDMPEPRLFQIDLEFNRKEEFHMNAIRKRSRATKQRMQSVLTPITTTTATGGSGTGRNNSLTPSKEDPDFENKRKLNRSHESPSRKRKELGGQKGFALGYNSKAPAPLTGHISKTPAKKGAYANLLQDQDEDFSPGIFEKSTNLLKMDSVDDGKDTRLAMEDDFASPGKKFSLIDSISPTNIGIGNIKSPMGRMKFDKLSNPEKDDFPFDEPMNSGKKYAS